MDLTQELQFAKKAALQAGTIIANHYGETLNVRHKSPEQPVTKADVEANQLIKEILTSEFTDDGWLSEEDIDDASRLTRSRVWIVDPLDGTKDFIEHNPEFAVSIALTIDQQSVLGVVYNPITKELFYGSKNQGAFCHEKKISVKKRDASQKYKLIVSRSEYRRGEWELLKDDFQIFTKGGCAYKMVKIAEGVADGTFTQRPKSEWDICAGEIIIREAGGIVTHLNGDPFVYNQEFTLLDGLISCNCPELHEKILEIVQPSL